MNLKLSARHKIYIIGFMVIAAALIAIAVAFGTLRGEKNYSRYMLEASECVSSGDYDGAISYLRKAAELDDTDECLLLMSECYEKEGNYEKALEVLRLLDSTDQSVTSKMSVLENKVRMESDADQITVGGEKHKTSETTLVLDNRSLGDSVVTEAAQLYSLSNLSLAGNDITDISAISSLGGLTTLNLSNNNISDISPLARLTSLRTLYLDNNPITDLTSLKSIPTLRSLSLKGISVDEDTLAELSEALPNCAINGDTAIAGDETITIGGETFDIGITELDLSGKDIIDLTALSRCEKLTRLVLSENEISDLTPLMDIPNLTYLDISDNHISDLRPLMGLGTIKYLNAADNNITSTVSLGMNTALQELNLSGNPIGNFSGIKKLKNLVTLNISDTGFTGSDAGIFQYLTKLLSLDITENEITGEEFDAIQSMLPICSIKHSDLIYTYDVDGFQIPSNTSDLNLNSTGITDLTSILSFPALEKLQLSGNGITDISPLERYEGWRTLKELDLSSNKITDVSALQHMSNLETLNLSDNLISDVKALYSLSNLRTLYIGGNLLTEEQIAELNRYLPNCEIVAW